ncbi:DUF116 domain-containing protein [archaeon]
MDFLGFELSGLFINAVVFGALALAVVTIVGVLLIHYFNRTGKAHFPKLIMITLNLLETPIKNLLWLFNLDDRTLHLVRSSINNILYRHRFAAIPFKERAIFLPQCLRNQACPAPTDAEGLHCKGCGKCSIAEYKKEAESKGYRFFIAPGGTMVKRMIKQYRPKGIIGVGCENEIQMGAEMAVRAGVVPMVVPLAKSGCLDTIVDWDELRKITNLTPKNVND